ncbi:MAG: lysophospholipid acyltransferase family protein [Bdellovibrionota bacterium]
MGRFFVENILPFILAPIYYLLRLTWRIREFGPPEVMERYVNRKGPSEGCVYCHWHGDELVLVGYYSYRKLAVLSSLSKDGTLMARTLGLLGYQVFRGSSSRGGARALIGLIRAVKDGSQSAMAVDGPRGPLHIVKPGVVELARKTGKAIIPVRTRADRAWHFPRSWNKTYLPKPFAKVEVEYGEPLLVKDEKAEEICAEAKRRMDAIG